MDFRLIDSIREWMQKEGMLCDADVVSLAGATKEILDGTEGAKDLVLKQIQLSAELHLATQVVIVHHSDCGAYRASYNFSTTEEEKEIQLRDMEKVKGIIKEKFPQMEVVKVWAQLKDAEGKEVEFEKI